jgi:hypothetical protein
MFFFSCKHPRIQQKILRILGAEQFIPVRMLRLTHSVEGTLALDMGDLDPTQSQLFAG